MSTIRFFSGGRDMTKHGAAYEATRFEIQKRGKLPAAERYKRIMQKKLEENKNKAMAGKAKSYATPFNFGEARKISKRTEQTLAEMAARKAKKLAKAERQMVIVQPRVFPNGTLNRRGQIYDIAGNLVANVNIKTGKIVANNGWDVGKYKSRSQWTGFLIQDTITKYSPYFIQQRKMLLMQQQGIEMVTSHGSMLPDTINVFGQQPQQDQSAFASGAGLAMGPRQNIGVTSWGARSDNVWGTYADNAWGQSADNVWGSNSTDVWGGMGSGSLWGSLGPHIWNTGGGVNYLKGLTSRIAAFFGLKTKAVKDNLKGLRTVRLASAGRSSASTRTATTRR